MLLVVAALCCGDSGGDSVCKGGSCKSCKSAIVNVVVLVRL